MLDAIAGYDWAQAFECAGDEPEGGGNNTPSVSCVYGWDGSSAPFVREDVSEILAIEDGENDGENWIGLFRLKDGRIAFLSAGCDYTGWECQSGGQAIVGPSVAHMLQFGLGDSDRARLADQIEKLVEDGLG